MKTIRTLRLHSHNFAVFAATVAGLLLSNSSLIGQPAKILPEAVITERGPNHRVWSRTERETQRDDKIRNKVSSFVELASGIHRLENNQWIETSDAIELVNGHAIARQLPYQVIWAANANTVGAVDFLTPDRQRLQSHCLGLAIYDPTTGQSLMIAELKDRVGELLPPNKIIYRDAFDSIGADLVYTARRDGFFQEVVLHEGVELPAGFGPQTRVEVWTEFINAPEPQKTAQVRDGVTDEAISFGEMRIGPGKAFSLGGDPNQTFSAPVSKRWIRTDGRTFLIEGVKFKTIQPDLEKLPAPKQQAALRRSRERQIARVGPDTRAFPAPRKTLAAAPGKAPERIQLASLPPPNRGFVLDYDLISFTNLVLQSDTTYYVSGPVNLTTPTFEGGCVIKYANTNGAKINLLGIPIWQTDQYRPAVFTARDDHSVGTQIGSAGISGYYASTALAFGSSSSYLGGNVRISYAELGAHFSDDDLLQNVQFVRCQTAVKVSQAVLELQNALIYECTKAFDVAGPGADVIGHHLTLNCVSNLYTTSSGGGLALTNSLLVQVTNIISFTADFIGTNGSAADTFQTVGGASHYLSANSPYRNLGTTNLGSGLLNDLRKRTTYPPVVLSGNLTTDTTLSPQAQRDTDTPDLGYHYDPLDFASSVLVVTNATLSLQPGTALAAFSTGSGTYGVSLFDGARLVSTGAPENLNRIVSYNTVQEQATTNWSGIVPSVVTYWGLMTVQPQSLFRFTGWSRLAQDGEHYHGYAASEGINDVIDCQIHGGQFTILRPRFNFTNSLFNRVALTVEDDFGSYTVSPAFHNNTLNGGSLSMVHYSADTWTFRNNLFAETSVSQDGDVGNDYNGYTTNVTRLLPNGSHDVLLAAANVGFQAGALGQFYLPTNSVFVDRGSTNAHLLGLYHFTTATNQVKETTTTNDLGFHYVAVTNGVPIDTDGDGLADYHEDKDGDGVADGNESNLTLIDTDGDGVSDFVEVLQGRNPNAGEWADTNGLANLRIFTPLK